MTITLTDAEARLVLNLVDIMIRSQGVMPYLELAKKIDSDLKKPVPESAPEKPVEVV